MPLRNLGRRPETMRPSGHYRGKMAEESRSMKLIQNFSPSGLKILVVDDDPLCLVILERMLRQCDYNVTTCGCVSQAIAMVTQNKDRFDLVICDVCLPDAEGFRLLEIVGLGLDLPVIMMSANGETSVVMKGITHGACDYLIKPIRIEELRNIWQHVVRRRGREYLKEDLGECDDREVIDIPEMISKKRKDTDSMDYSEDSVIDDISSLKKARVHWTVQLHQQFVTAVNQLGIDKAVPKKIVEIMKVQGLSRENVASHLQKYRLYLKRLSGTIPEPYPVASFQAAEDSVSGGTMHIRHGGKDVASSSVVKGLNLGLGASPSLGMGRGIDPGTLKSLQQYRAYEQKLAANRAQVLGGIGIIPPKISDITNAYNSNTRSMTGLQRMTSVDMGLLWRAHCEQAAEVNEKPRTNIIEHVGPRRFKNVVNIEDHEVDVSPIHPTVKHSTSRHSRTQSMFNISTAFIGAKPATNFQNNCPDKRELLEIDELNPMEDIAWLTSSQDEKTRSAATPVNILDNLEQDFGSTSASVMATDQITNQASANVSYEGPREVSVGSDDFFSTGSTDISDYLIDDFMSQPR